MEPPKDGKIYIKFTDTRSNIWQHLNIFKESLRIPHDLRGRKELEEIQRFQNVWPITFFSLFQSIDPRSGGGEVERPITLPPLFTCRPRKLAYGEKENNDQWIYFTYLTTSIWHCDYVVPWNAMFIKEQTNPFLFFLFFFWRGFDGISLLYVQYFTLMSWRSGLEGSPCFYMKSLEVNRKWTKIWICNPVFAFLHLLNRFYLVLFFL